MPNKLIVKEAVRKLTRAIDTEPQKSLKRADVVSSSGFVIVVDGIFKNEFDSDAAARQAARGLLEKYPMLRVEVYDAAKKARTLLE